MIRINKKKNNVKIQNKLNSINFQSNLTKELQILSHLRMTGDVFQSNFYLLTTN